MNDRFRDRLDRGGTFLVRLFFAIPFAVVATIALGEA